MDCKNRYISSYDPKFSHLWLPGMSTVIVMVVMRLRMGWAGIGIGIEIGAGGR